MSHMRRSIWRRYFTWPNTHVRGALTGFSDQLGPYSAIAACLSAIIGPRMWSDRRIWEGN